MCVCYVFEEKMCAVPLRVVLSRITPDQRRRTDHGRKHLIEESFAGTNRLVAWKYAIVAREFREQAAWSGHWRVWRICDCQMCELGLPGCSGLHLYFLHTALR